MSEDEFDLETFLPYLLNQAAEATSRTFQATYRADFGMTRTQWRVMANLGKFGAMTAADICRISHIEKTKVSRAVAALEDRGFLSRARAESDRRAEVLTLTEDGRDVFLRLGRRAIAYDLALRESLGQEVVKDFVRVLRGLIAAGDWPLDGEES